MVSSVWSGLDNMMISLLFAYPYVFVDMFLHMAYSLYAQIPLNIFIFIYYIYISIYTYISTKTFQETSQRFTHGSPHGFQGWSHRCRCQAIQSSFGCGKISRESRWKKSKTEGSSAFCSSHPGTQLSRSDGEMCKAPRDVHVVGYEFWTLFDIWQKRNSPLDLVEVCIYGKT